MSDETKDELDGIIQDAAKLSSRIEAWAAQRHGEGGPHAKKPEAFYLANRTLHALWLLAEERAR